MKGRESMDTKHAIVINKQGYKAEFVLVDFQEKNGQVLEIPQCYILKENESFIYEDISIAQFMIQPRWNGVSWEETATSEDIEANRLAKLELLYPWGGEPGIPQPTEMELFAAELSLAIAEVQTKMDMAIAELCIAIAECYTNVYVICDNRTEGKRSNASYIYQHGENLF